MPREAIGQLSQNKAPAVINLATMNMYFKSMMMMMMMMMMLNCFCGMADRRKVFGLISSRDHCQRSSPSRISNTPGAGFEPARNLSSGLVE